MTYIEIYNLFLICIVSLLKSYFIFLPSNITLPFFRWRRLDSFYMNISLNDVLWYITEFGEINPIIDLIYTMQGIHSKQISN